MNSTSLLSVAVKSCYTHHTFCSILDAGEDDTFVSISEYWRSYSIADCIGNIKESWINWNPWLCLCARKAVGWSIYDFLDKIKNILVIACKVQGEGFRDFKEADIQELSTFLLLNSLWKTQQVTVISEPEDEEESDMDVDRTQMIATSLKKGL